VRRGVGVGVAQVGQSLNVMLNPAQLRVDVVEDGVAVDERAAERVAQPAQRLGGCRKRQVDLDRIHLFGDRGERLEQRFELRRDWPRVNILCRCNPLRRGFFGAVNDIYLLPNTVVAVMLGCTLAGTSLMYFGSNSNTSLAAGLPSRSISEMLPTRPISTPL
jgi:hypothetical protein